MPFVGIETNVVLDPDRTPAFLAALCAHVAEILNKPPQFVMVSMRAAAMHFDGNDCPAAFVVMKSISLQRQQCPALSAALCAFLERELGVTPERVYIEFSIIEGPLFGWNGTTF